MVSSSTTVWGRGLEREREEGERGGHTFFVAESFCKSGKGQAQREEKQSGKAGLGPRSLYELYSRGLGEIVWALKGQQKLKLECLTPSSWLSLLGRMQLSVDLAETRAAQEHDGVSIRAC